MIYKPFAGSSLTEAYNKDYEVPKSCRLLHPNFFFSSVPLHEEEKTFLNREVIFNRRINFLKDLIQKLLLIKISEN